MKILLPVDGSQYTQRMLSYLAEHKELLGAGHEYLIFTSVAAVPPTAAHFIRGETLENYYQDHAEVVLRPVKAFADQQGWTIRVAHAAGPAADTIAAFAEIEKPDLIVMGSHGHSALGSMMLGSVSTGVLARCKIPLLLIR